METRINNIYYFTPFDITKKIGNAHNKCCEIVPNGEDWIILMDGDIMFLTPDFGQIIQSAIDRHGDAYDLMGCLMNRIGLKHQLNNDTFSIDGEISNHLKIANECKNNNNITSCNIVAGAFMLFQKKTWDKVGGFDISIHFDRIFSNKLIDSGGKLGIIQSLYVFHLYRWGAKNPPYEYKHLL